MIEIANTLAKRLKTYRAMEQGIKEAKRMGYIRGDVDIDYLAASIRIAMKESGLYVSERKAKV